MRGGRELGSPRTLLQEAANASATAALFCQSVPQELFISDGKGRMEDREGRGTLTHFPLVFCRIIG